MPEPGFRGKDLKSIWDSKTPGRRSPSLASAAHQQYPQTDVPGLTLGSDFREATFERHASNLARLSHPMYSRRKSDLVLQLQRDYGNRYVQRLVDHIGARRADQTHRSKYTVQSKLTVGPAGDRYEREADRVAKKAVDMDQPQDNRYDQRLENETDVMGAKALQVRRPDQVAIGPIAQSATVAQQAGEPTEAAEVSSEAIGASGGKVHLNSLSIDTPMPTKVLAKETPSGDASDISSVVVQRVIVVTPDEYEVAKGKAETVFADWQSLNEHLEDNMVDWPQLYDVDDAEGGFELINNDQKKIEAEEYAALFYDGGTQYWETKRAGWVIGDEITVSMKHVDTTGDDQALLGTGGISGCLAFVLWEPQRRTIGHIYAYDLIAIDAGDKTLEDLGYGDLEEYGKSAQRAWVVGDFPMDENNLAKWKETLGIECEFTFHKCQGMVISPDGEVTFSSSGLEMMES